MDWTPWRIYLRRMARRIKYEISWLRRALLAVVIVVVIVSIFPAIRYYGYFSTHVSTDDAYVDGTVALVSTRVSGTVSAVYVEDNWTVKSGDLLVTLDPSDFQV